MIGAVLSVLTRGVVKKYNESTSIAYAVSSSFSNSSDFSDSSILSFPSNSYRVPRIPRFYRFSRFSHPLVPLSLLIVLTLLDLQHRGAVCPCGAPQLPRGGGAGRDARHTSGEHRPHVHLHPLHHVLQSLVLYLLLLSSLPLSPLSFSLSLLFYAL